ncbi:DoxX family protein [Haloactinomyces albus]|uniref:Oxidoreductase n=1 Tax=Haloactinomyces albus TaxID=1352928 RepID=A0AAE3ZHL7_9ACTN|nr:DoxX family protein [Haloactinomyces albus]MDR7304200.1 putative oxidoreductase [Haloactinomyces albus]
MNGAEVARIVLRASVGSTMLVHGIAHGRSIKGTAKWFKSIGFSQPRLQARSSAVVEVGAGSALVLGAATPLAASAVVGTMAVAARTVHIKNGFFITKEGYEYVLSLSAASVALSALGSGTASVDRLLLGRRERMSGLQRAALTTGLGLGAAAAQLAAFWSRPQPASTKKEPEQQAQTQQTQQTQESAQG